MVENTDSMENIFVTGSNAPYFPMLCLLLASFDRFAPGVPLYVCDFGLTEGQANFLATKGLLLPRPDHIATGLHPYLYKGRLNDFVTPLNFDVLTWIDSDCVLTGLFAAEVQRLIAQHEPDQPFLYVTADLVENHTLGSFIARNPEKTRPFAKALADSKLPHDKPYLSCGLFILRSKPLLQEWAKLTTALPPHFLFEQNAFNIVAYQYIQRITLLDWVTFSVCGSKLNDLTVLAGGHYPGSIRLQDTITIVIHIAATNEQAAISFEPFIFPVGNQFLCGLFRFPNNPALNQFVMGLMAEYAFTNPTNQKLLLESGSLCTENPLNSSKENFLKDPKHSHLFKLWQ
jgi:hypothetical protein